MDSTKPFNIIFSDKSKAELDELDNKVNKVKEHLGAVKTLIAELESTHLILEINSVEGSLSFPLADLKK